MEALRPPRHAGAVPALASVRPPRSQPKDGRMTPSEVTWLVMMAVILYWAYKMLKPYM
jgi:hypothetical protein